MGEEVELSTLIEGYRRAHARFVEARLEEESAEAFIPLFEALSWAVSLDERLERPSHPELRGLRYARHSVHHKWADALWLDRGEFLLPAPLPMKFMEWKWRENLIAPRNREDDAAYKEHLAGRASRHTLDAVLAFLDQQL
jgi:hypothetical protein